MELPSAGSIAAGISAALAVFVAWSTYEYFFGQPQRLLKLVRAQGIPGFPFRPFTGQLKENLEIKLKRDSDPEYAAATHYLPMLVEGREVFGRVHTIFFGQQLRIILGDPGLARQAFVTLNSAFDKNVILKCMTVLQQGVLTSDGPMWGQQRRLLNPAFSHREVRRLFPTMLQCSVDAITELEGRVRAHPGQPVRMDKELGRLALDVISRSAFGMHLDALWGDSVVKEVLVNLKTYMEAFMKAVMQATILPALWYLPSSSNAKVWTAERSLRRAMKKVVAARIKRHKRSNENVGGSEDLNGANKGTVVGGNEANGVQTVGVNAASSNAADIDLLELMLSATEGLAEEIKSEKEANGALVNGDGDENEELNRMRSTPARPFSFMQLMSNCITFLLAGHETTGTMMTMTVVLLSQHVEWQERARAEVLAVLGKGDETPSIEQLNELKIVNWILLESLRLLPPVGVVARVCNKATRISDTLTVPQGCEILVPIALLHRDKEYWGEDANEFRPDRFANGISQAVKHPGAFVPFSMGPRNCIGQNFALAEGKAVMALLLKKFSWRLHESYTQHLELNITLCAKRGVPVVLNPL